MNGDEPLRIAVAGGSIGGLCAGIALNGIGADVQVYERQPGPMETRGAGIVVQADLTNLLRRHNAPELPTTGCRIRRYLEPEGGGGRVETMAQRFTSWEAIYRTLRATFPDERYHMRAMINGFEQSGDLVTIEMETQKRITADLLVSADGASSVTRQKLLPNEKPHYAGYVAWRGTLDEATAPPDLVVFFDDAFTFSEARSGGHMLTYFIPGEDMATEHGKRRLNWVWYVRTDEDNLAKLLVDREGHQHHSSLPPGLAQQQTVSQLKERARRELHPMMARLIEATSDPFVQTIVDLVVPRTVFGRVVLLGDAAFVVRPHTAAAAAKAAQDAMVLAASLRRAGVNVDAGLRGAERVQLETGQNLAQYGQALGRRWTSTTS